MEWLAWEDQAVTYRHHPDFFANLAPEEVPLVAQILHQQCSELFQDDLFYLFEKSLTMLALLRTQQLQFDKFVPLAKMMGTREWQRITRMAEMAEAHQRRDIALAVYEAALPKPDADEPGRHEEYLRQEYEKLKARAAQAEPD